MADYYASTEIGFCEGPVRFVPGSRIFRLYETDYDGGLEINWERGRSEVLAVLRRHLNDPCVLHEDGTLLTGAQVLTLIGDVEGGGRR